ncbi:MAG: 3-phosphoserine/phosphohydroxythreonine transaminase [Clostridia bacterium]|nr:3-phosphoserine/phosphohydroxythreonine transaminase [Clostridia bacterium]MBQ4620717.1 3-phosphoserine/phosphohydroxythreonine transaminase [Clostridia bacterium]
MNRVYNFAAGPSMLPEEALERAASEMLSYKGTGMSVMEMSHRSKGYIEIFDHTVSLLRELMGISDDYEVLLLQGGATGQFAAVPMNLLKTSADYVDSGNFAHGALVEAKKYGNINVVASSRDDNYTYIPEIDPAKLNKNADYFYITTNNTIFGTRYTSIPDTGDVPLVADMSSNILSEPMDVNKFGVIFAGAQKNIGPAGVTVVIIRKDLLGRANANTPKVFDWTKMAENGSMLNTPTTYSIYMAGLCLEWLKKEGGVRVIHMRNQIKAKLLYDYLDESKLFKGTAHRDHRSIMNVTFRTDDPDTDAAFVKLATENGILNIKGHRLVGGMRASIYNAMSVEGVQKLITIMKQFEQERV